MLKFEAKRGDFAKIWQKLGATAPGSAAHDARVISRLVRLWLNNNETFYKR